MFILSDDLNDVQPTMEAPAKAAPTPVPTAVRAPESTTAAPTAAPPVPAPTVLLDADEDFDASAYSNSLPKLKVADGTVARFAVLGPVAEGFRHYNDETKTYYRCISKRGGKRPAITEKAQCCDLCDEAKYYRSALVLHYTDADPKSGKLKGDGWQLAALVVSGAGWGQLKNMVPEGVKTADVDFKAMPRTNGFGLEFAFQASPAAWKKASPEFQAQVMTEAERLKVQLEAKLGKVLTPLQLKAIAGQTRDSDDLDSLAELGD
jgi:hypothetical protein